MQVTKAERIITEIIDTTTQLQLVVLQQHKVSKERTSTSKSKCVYRMKKKGTALLCITLIPT